MVPRLRQGIEPGLLASTQEHLRLYSVQVRTKAIHSQGISTLDFTIAFSDAIEEEVLVQEPHTLAHIKQWPVV